jgi:hypothetical protein
VSSRLHATLSSRPERSAASGVEGPAFAAALLRWLSRSASCRSGRKQLSDRAGRRTAGPSTPLAALRSGRDDIGVRGKRCVCFRVSKRKWYRQVFVSCLQMILTTWNPQSYKFTPGWSVALDLTACSHGQLSSFCREVRFRAQVALRNSAVCLFHVEGAKKYDE